MDTKLQKYNLLIAKDLWQAHYQVLLLKESIKLKVMTDTVIKNMKFAELNIRIATVFLKTQTLRIT